MSDDTANNAARVSLFASETLEGLAAALREAVTAGDVRVCEMVVAAAVASDAGRMEEASELFDAAFMLTSDERLLFAGYQFFFRFGDSARAERWVRRRIEAAGGEGAENETSARAWNNLGLIYHFRGDQESAEAMMRRSLEIDTKIGNEFGVARDLGNLSLIPEVRGDLDEAERLNREALAIAERIGAEVLVAGRLCNLGEIAMVRGRREEARELLVRSEALFAKLGVEKSRLLCVKRLEELGQLGA